MADIGHNESTARAADLKAICEAARPLIEESLDIAEQLAAMRETATAKGLDWSQIKALLKAQIQDERDEAGESKRVARIIEKADFACAYADMLGFTKMNEKNNSGGDEPEPPTPKPERRPASLSAAATPPADLDLPPFLDRRARA